jgi:dephospho-CoA kinase
MPDHSAIVVGVAGRIGSGKSMVAHCLEQEFGFQYFRYSLVLAEWSCTDPNDKARLQEIGEEVMAGEGQVELNRQLIKRVDPTRNATVDGLRHPVDHQSLLAEFGPRYFLIFVDTPPRIRFERSRGRFGTYEQFLEADSRPVESNIDLLRPSAATTIPGTMSMGELTSKLSELTISFRLRIPL